MGLAGAKLIAPPVHQFFHTYENSGMRTNERADELGNHDNNPLGQGCSNGCAGITMFLNVSDLEIVPPGIGRLFDVKTHNNKRGSVVFAVIRRHGQHEWARIRHESFLTVRPLQKCFNPQKKRPSRQVGGEATDSGLPGHH